MRRDVLKLLGGRLGMAVARALALILLARVLSPADLGRFSFLIAAFVVFTQITSLGTEPAATVLLARSGEDRPRRWSAILALALLLTVLSSALFWGVDRVFGERLFEGLPRSALHLSLFSLLPGQMVIALRGALSGLGRFGCVSALSLVQWGGYLGALVVWRWQGGTSIEGATICFLAPVWIAFLAGLALVRLPVRLDPGRACLRETFDLGLRSHAAQVLTFLQMRLDLVLLRVLSSADQLGYYAVATNATEWMLYLPRAMGSAAMPRAARSEAVGEKAFALQFGLMFAAATLLFVLAPVLVTMVFGSEYAPAIWMVRALLVGTVLLGHGTLATGVLLGRQAHAPLMRAGICVVAGFLVLDVLFLPRGGALAAAIISSALYSVYSLYLTRVVFAGDWSRIARSFRAWGSLPWARA